MQLHELRSAFDKIRVFYPLFTITEQAIDEYHKRLKNYDRRALYSAVEEICTSSERAPTLSHLIKVVKAHQQRYAAGKYYVQVGGYAPQSDAKRELMSESIRELRALTDKTSTEAIEGLKDIYQSAYKQLPGYVGSSEIRRLVDEGAFDELHRLGAVVGHYKPGQGVAGFLGMRE